MSIEALNAARLVVTTLGLAGAAFALTMTVIEIGRWFQSDGPYYLDLKSRPLTTSARVADCEDKIAA